MGQFINIEELILLALITIVAYAWYKTIKNEN